MFKDKRTTDFYERLYKFAKDCVIALRSLPRTYANQNFSRQLIRASSSVPANYIEAQESLSRKDFVYRMAVCRKEAKEAAQWLRMIIDTNEGSDFGRPEFQRLLAESQEIVKIFSKSLNTLKAED